MLRALAPYRSPAPGRPWAAFWLLAALLVLAGCDGGGSVSPAGLRLQDTVRVTLTRLGPAAAEALAEYEHGGDRRALEGLLAGWFALATQRERPLPFTVALLDARGRYLAARSPAGQEGQGLAEPYRRMGFRGYGFIALALDKGRTSQDILYQADGRLWLVAHPLDRRGRRVGALVLACRPGLPALTRGVSPEEFQGLDFTPF